MTDSKSDETPPILVIAGPTATGKTGAALELAARFDGELVGADSVQVYRGFDIGSAKPTREELGELVHHLIDVVDPDEDIDAAAYSELADQAIEATVARGRLPIVVGGTGLWLRALLRGLVDVPPVDPEVRARLESAVDVGGAPALHARLAAVDPATAESVHPNDALRIIRALEVYEQTGTPLGELRAAHALGEPRYRSVFVVLDTERDRHARLIEERTQGMIEAGWIDEVRELREAWGDDVRPLGSVGYREVLAHLRDGIPLDETVRLIRKSTRKYARRQRTWFKSDPSVNYWTNRDALLEHEAVARLRKELRR
jgi:tRNA dimethylallyltransferase